MRLRMSSTNGVYERPRWTIRGLRAKACSTVGASCAGCNYLVCAVGFHPGRRLVARMSNRCTLPVLYRPGRTPVLLLSRHRLRQPARRYSHAADRVVRLLTSGPVAEVTAVSVSAGTRAANAEGVPAGTLSSDPDRVRSSAAAWTSMSGSRDGRPHLSPNWFCWDGRRFFRLGHARPGEVRDRPPGPACAAAR